MINMMSYHILRRQLARQRLVVPFSLRLADSAAASLCSNSHSPDQDPNRSQPQQKPPPPLSLEENPYFSKYEQKIRMAQQSGATVAKSPENETQSDAMAIGMKKMHEKYLQAEQLSQTPIEAISSSRRKSLSDILRLDMVDSMSAEEISEIWMQHHRQKDHCLYAVLQQSEYEKLFDVATQYAVFLFPLPKTLLPEAATESVNGPESGYQLYLSRFKDHSFFLTPLSDYQRDGELAVPSLVISHFPELSSQKQVVFMNGTYDPATLTAVEAQCLANQVKLFYCGSEMRKLLLLHTFNKEPERFNYMDVIRVIEGK